MHKKYRPFCVVFDLRYCGCARKHIQIHSTGNNLENFQANCEFLGSECERKIFCRDRENELCACGGCSPSVKVYRNVSVLECAQFWIPNQYIRMDNPGLSLFNGGQSLQLDAVCDLIKIVFDVESGL